MKRLAPGVIETWHIRPLARCVDFVKLYRMYRRMHSRRYAARVAFEIAFQNLPF